MDRNAPAALWGAIGEDDVGKLDELRRYGSEMTQGYLAAASNKEKHALKPWLERHYQKRNKLLMVVKKQ